MASSLCLILLLGATASLDGPLSARVWQGSVHGFPTLKEVDSFFAAAVDYAPDAVGLPREIGRSVEDRPIVAVCVGLSCVGGAVTRGDAPAAALLTALTHPREPLALLAVMRFAAALLEGRRARPDGTEAGIVASRQVWIVAAANPDGYAYNLAILRANARPNVDDLVRKNRRRAPGSTCSAASAGVDLNRNFPVCFAVDDVGSQLKPCEEDFRGAGKPLSEPEAQALAALVGDPALHFGTALNYHSFGKYINLPYMCRSKGTPPAKDYAAFKFFAHEASLENGYAWGHPWESGFLYTVNGDVSDWMYDSHGILAMSPEMGPGELFLFIFFPGDVLCDPAHHLTCSPSSLLIVKMTASADPVATDLDGFIPAESATVAATGNAKILLRRAVVEETLAISMLAAQMAGAHLVPTVTVSATLVAGGGDGVELCATVSALTSLLWSVRFAALVLSRVFCASFVFLNAFFFARFLHFFKVWIANVGSAPSSATTHLVATLRATDATDATTSALLGVIDARSTESRSAVLTARVPPLAAGAVGIEVCDFFN